MVNDLVKVPQLNATMREMAKEMMKAGMIDEIIDDTLGDALDTEEMEEETEAEIDKAGSPYCPLTITEVLIHLQLSMTLQLSLPTSGGRRLQLAVIQ